MNEERLLKVIQDMKEVIGNLKECKQVLEDTESDNTTIFIEFGLKQIFVDFFITVENFTSMVLKEFKKYRIGIDMKESLNILLENKVLLEEEFIFLNEARLLRNRISHRYKEPSKEELLTFISKNVNHFDNIVNIAVGFLSEKWHIFYKAMIDALCEVTGKQAYRYRAFELLVTLDLDIYKAVRKIIVPADIQFK